MSVRGPGVSFASASPRGLAVAVSSSPSSVVARNTALLPPMSPASLPPDAKRTLHVHLASTGRYFELSVGLSESIASLKESLAGVLAISPTDQILLTDTGVAMDERRTLGQHSFVAASNADIRVFVFNRGDLTAAAQQQRRQLASAPMTLPLPPLLLPTDHDSLVRCPPRRAIVEARGSYTKMMPTFEQHFCRSLLEANVYLGAFADLLRRARNGRVEQEAVMAALDAALLNLDTHADRVRTNASTFKQSFDSAAKLHHALFDGFARDVEALKEVEITGKMRRYAGVIQPPSPAMEPVPAGATTAPLALTPAALPVAPAPAPSTAAPSSPRLTLHAMVSSSLPTLTRLREQLSHDQTHLDRKVEEMTGKWTKVDAKVRELRVGPDRTPAHRKPEILSTLAELAHLLRADPSNEHSVEAFAAIHQQLQADYSAVVEYLDQLERQLTIAAPASNGASQLLDLPLSVDDAFKKFKELDDQHDDLLERFRQQWTFLSQSMVQLLAQSASAIQTVFVNTHAQLALLSTHVTNVESVLPMQTIALQRLGDVVREKFQPIHMLPTAYAALLTEVPRRRAFHRRFLQEAKAMADRIQTVAAGERQRRAEWQQQYGAFLPKGASLPGGRSGWSGGFGSLLSHMFDLPPMIDLSFADFDMGLPDLDGSDASAAAQATAGAASGGKSPKLHVAGSLSRNSSSNALPSLPAIEEASSGSGSNGDAEDAAGDHTHSIPRPKGSAAERAVEDAFPWMAELEKERAKVRALEKELAAMREQREQSTSLAKNLAATISPAGGKATGSRKNSLTEQQQQQASSTNSPTASSRSSGASASSSSDWRAKFEAEKQRSDELTLNAAAQEKKLAEFKDLESQKTKLIEALERAQADLKTEQEGRKRTAKDAYENFKSSQEKMETAARRIEVTESECDMLRQQLELLSLRSAHKLALNDFTISDLILFYQNPSRIGPGGGGGLDQLEVFNLNAPNYFLSPDSAQAYKTKLRMRQEKLDETMAKAMHAAGGVSSPAAAAAAPAAAAVDPSSSSSSAASPPPAVVPFGDIGQVLFVHSGLVASAGQNPFRLPIGTKYHLLDVEMQLQEDQEEKQS